MAASIIRNFSHRLHPRGRRFLLCRGVTLIELMVAVAILAIVASLAAPSMERLLARNETKAAEIDLKGDLLFARREAVGRNSRVIVCPMGADTLTCDVSSASKWTNGWTVCRDSDQDFACDASSATRPNPLRFRSPSSAASSITGPAQIVFFNGYGEVALSTSSGVVSRPSSVTFQITSSRFSDGISTITIQRSGADTQ